MTAAPTQRVVVVGQPLTIGEFHVHAAGCADLKRDPNLRHEDQSFVVDAATRVEVCDAVYPPGEFEPELFDEFDCESGEYLDRFHFASCVILPTTGAPS